MTSFSDVASALALPSCCMRNNPGPKQQLKDDLTVLSVTFGLYLFSYWCGFHSLCILSMAVMNMITFQAGISFHEYYSKPIHLNQFDELDTSTSSEDTEINDDVTGDHATGDHATDELSLKQREQGASVSRVMSEEEQEKLYQQLREVVEETNIRNRKRRILNTARTPSSTTLYEEGEISSYPAIPKSDTDDDRDDYKDMPPLVSQDQPNTILHPIYQVDARWANVPNFSQTHYLHNYMDEVD